MSFSLLMVKDFDSTGFLADDTFMTNADTPVIAFDGLVENPVNPFTGKQLSSDAKFAGEHRVFYTDFWNTTDNNGNTFLPGSWYALRNQNLFDMNNWEKIGDY